MTGVQTCALPICLARYFNTTPGYWIGMQAQFDLETARDEWDAKIRAEVKPRQAA